MTHTTPTPQHLYVRPCVRPWRRVRSWLALITVGITVGITGITLTAPGANAAGARGAGGNYTPQGGWLGNYVGGARQISSEDTRWLNYLISVHGQTGDPAQAEAVAALVYNVMSQNHHGNGAHYIGSSTPNRQHVRNLYNSLKADVDAHYQDNTNGNSSSGSVEMQVDVDQQNHYQGRLTLVDMLPSGATCTVTLTNARFVSTGTNTATGLGNGTYPLTVVPPDSPSEFEVFAHASCTFQGGTYYDDNLMVYTEERQRCAGPGTTGTNTVTFTADASDPTSVPFSPVVSSTQVSSKIVHKGEYPSDVLHFGVAANPDGSTNAWYQNTHNRQYSPVVAKGTAWYTPTKPVPGATVPADAVVAGRGAGTTSLAGGPTITYTARSDTPASESGYVTWVWTIHYSDQDARSTQRYLPGPSFWPPNDRPYSWASQFGVVSETSMTPPDIVTEAVPTLTLGQRARDTAIVTGPVYEGATIGFKAYKQTTDAAGNVTGAPVCEQSNLAFTSGVRPVTGPGRIESDTVVFSALGTYFWVYTLYYDDDDGRTQQVQTGTCGAPGETTTVTAPGVSTTAQTEIPLGVKARDTAHITGPIATTAGYSWQIGFKAYNQATDTSGNLLGNPVCEAANLAFTSGVKPVTGTGDVTSDEVVFPSPGKYFWVQTLWMVAGDGTRFVAAQGVCGAPGETTKVNQVNITTTATSSVTLGQRAQDVARITGTIPPGSQLVWRIYKSTGTPTPVCETANLVHTSTPVGVASGLVNGIEYHSYPVILTAPGVYYWIETLTDIDGNTITQGVCGAAGETTTVTPPGMTTTATSSVTLGQHARDTAHVTGPVATDTGRSWQVEFQAFKQSTDTSGNLTGNPVCEASNLVFTSGMKSVTGTGDVHSDPIVFTAPRTYFWIATLWMNAPDGTRYLATKGTCGAAGESTTVTPPEVSTTAHSEVPLGFPAHDTANITGPIATNNGYTWQIEFQAFKQSTDTSGNLTGNPVCEATNLVFTSRVKQVLSVGDIDSDRVVFTARGKYFWVQTLWMVDRDRTRHLATQGVCGAPGETTTVIPVPTVSTTAQPEVVLGQYAHDTAIITGQGYPGASIGFKLYKQNVDAAGNLTGNPVCEQSSLVCTSGAKPITGPGRIDSDATVFTAPGKYFWVETLYYTDPTGRTHEVQTGTCGAVGETTIVTPPGVSTSATSSVTLGQHARDTAHIAGLVATDTGHTWEAGFEAFKQTTDATGNLTGAPVCEASNLVFTSTVKPVTGAGDVDSGPVVFTAPGTYFWIATLWMIAGDGTRHLATKGTCGADGETTTVTPPGVSTSATSSVTLGQHARDTAHITGPVATDTGHTWEVGFEAFKQTTDADGNLVSGPVCEAANLVFTSGTKPVTGTGDVDSDPVVFTAPGTYFWIATLWMVDRDRTRHLAAKGTCGASGETTTVTQPEVSTTAHSEVPFGFPAHDTASTTGPIATDPRHSWEVGFQAFKQEVDTAGNLVSGPVCEAANLVFTSGAKLVTGVGNIDSDAVVFAAPGTYFWVQTLWMVDRDGTRYLATQGTCGAAGETTTVVPVPNVSTAAQPEVVLGQYAHDTAIVTGQVYRGASIGFKAYKQNVDAAGNLTGNPVCEQSSLVFTSGMKPVTGPGRVDSDATVFTAPGKYFWV